MKTSNVKELMSLNYDFLFHKCMLFIAVCKGSYVVQAAILTEWENDRFSVNNVTSANDMTL